MDVETQRRQLTHSFVLPLSSRPATVSAPDHGGIPRSFLHASALRPFCQATTRRKLGHSQNRLHRLRRKQSHPASCRGKPAASDLPHGAYTPARNGTAQRAAPAERLSARPP